MNSFYRTFQNYGTPHTQTKIFENTNWPIGMHRLSYNKKIVSANISTMTAQIEPRKYNTYVQLYVMHVSFVYYVRQIIKLRVVIEKRESYELCRIISPNQKHAQMQSLQDESKILVIISTFVQKGRLGFSQQICTACKR